MPRRILVIIGHPDPSPDRLCRALAASYAEGARAAGHSVTVIDIADLDIPLLRSAGEFEHGQLPPSLEKAASEVAAAEHLVFVFPLWLGGAPALLKAFMEQIMRPGIAFAYPEAGGSGFAKSLLKGRTARVVVTMGMPALVFRLWYLDHGVAAFRRNILNFVGIKPVRQTLIGLVGAADETRSRKWLAQMNALGRKAR